MTLRKLAILTLGILLILGLAPRQPSTRAVAPTEGATMAATESADVLFDGNEALKHAQAQVDFGVRPTGSEASYKTGEYILAALRSYGWTATEQPFTLNINGQSVKGRNL